MRGGWQNLTAIHKNCSWQTKNKGECPQHYKKSFKTFSSVQSISYVWLSATPWTAARQASPSITNSQSLLKLVSIELMMSSNHLILCCPLLLSPSILPSTRVFSYESVLRIRWPKYWSFGVDFMFKIFLISSLIFIIFFPPFADWIVCSSFLSESLDYWFQYFVMYAFNAINLPLSSSFAAS